MRMRQVCAYVFEIGSFFKGMGGGREVRSPNKKELRSLGFLMLNGQGGHVALA